RRQAGSRCWPETPWRPPWHWPAGNGGQVVGGNHGGGGGAGRVPSAAVTPPGGAGGRLACLPPGFERANGAAALISSPENTNATEPASGGSTEYINHHLHHLQVSVGDGAFMTLNV